MLKNRLAIPKVRRTVSQWLAMSSPTRKRPPLRQTDHAHRGGRLDGGAVTQLTVVVVALDLTAPPVVRAQAWNHPTETAAAPVPNPMTFTGVEESVVVPFP